MCSTKFQGPPMGWNSWYCFSEGVSDSRIRETADAVAARGLNKHGWQYVNIDDCWQGERGGKFDAIQGNERFPDMKALADHVHSRGLKFGIYSTPWICTYAGFIGGSTDGGKEIELRIPLEERLQPHQVYGRCPGGMKIGVYRVGSEWRFDDDVRQWDEWGVDFVKVDWLPNDVPTTKRIAEDLKIAKRPIVLSLSNTTPFENIEELSKLAEMWRVSGDVHDKWESIRRIGFELAPQWIPYGRPGHWNDLDMLQIGDIGTANALNPSYRPSNLTFEEQKTQFVLWSLYSSPLLLSCDIAGMDDRTFELLTNDAVIAIDQDELCAPPVITEADEEIKRVEKALADGTRAVAFFNLSDEERTFKTVEEGRFTDLFTGDVSGMGKVVLPPHGCVIGKSVK